jgi:hypothetical protein
MYQATEVASALKLINSTLQAKGWGNAMGGFKGLKPLPSFNSIGALMQVTGTLGIRPNSTAQEMTDEVMRALNGDRGTSQMKRVFDFLVKK